MPRWTINAKNDLKAQLDYIALDNADAARDIAKIIKSSCANIDQFPSIGRDGIVKGTRELVINNTPYICIYRATAHDVEILRLLHARMKWPK